MSSQPAKSSRGKGRDTSARPFARREMPWGDLPRGQESASGIVIVDKPAGVTSHDVVGAMRRLAGTRKVGHAGTLDPMATGILVIGVGAATKLLTYLSGADKDYSATFRFGVGTDTEDSTGKVMSAPGFSGGEAEVDRAFATLTGSTSQVPSIYSAKKVAGRRAYDLARAGEAVELAANEVFIARVARCGDLRPATQEVEGREVEVADVDVEVTCSSGTYVRAIARDAGGLAGSAGLMSALRRTRVGQFGSEAARTMEELAAQVREDGTLSVIPLAAAAQLALPALSVSAAEADLLRHGQFIDREASDFPVALVCGEDDLVAIGVRRGDQIGPTVVFNR